MLPLLSVTVHNTVVVPIGYVPLASDVLLKSFTNDATPQLSLVVGETTVTAAVHTPASAACV